MFPAYTIFIRVAASMDLLQGNCRRQEIGYLDMKSACQDLHWSTLNWLMELFGGVSVFEMLVKACVMFFSLVYFPENSYDEVGRFFVKYTG